MERYGKVKPIYLNNVERQQKLSSHKNVYSLHQGEVIPACHVQKSKQFVHKHKKGSLQETSSSSSSSSSSSTSTSESEEEYAQQVASRKSMSRHFQKHQQRLLQQSPPRKWYTMVNLEGLIHPTQVTAKLNSKCHILVIKAKQTLNNVPSKREEVLEQSEDVLPQSAGIEESSGKIVRVIPLPQSIYLHQIKVQITPNGQQIIVKAPFVLPGEESQVEEEEEQQTRYSSTWVPIPVTIKDTSVDALNYPQHLLPRRTAPFPSEYTQKEQRGMYYIPGKQWQTISLNKEQQQQQQQWELSCASNSSKLVRPEYIRDPVTGKLAMLVKVNIVGFLPEEVVVRVDQARGVLIVEANKKQEQPLVDRRETNQHQQQILEQGLPMKCIRREFVLPKWLDITHIGYRVLQDGLLTIKLPIIELNKDNKLQGLDEVDEEEQQQPQVKNLDWETPLSA
jgi:HSP20 family molecular chaperone IbpA